MKKKMLGFLDVFRVVSTLLLTFLVAVFVAPIAPWVFWIAVFASFYVVGLEILKFYLGMKELRSGKHTEIIRLNE